MLKLLASYHAEPTLKTAHKIKANYFKHPMSVCFLMQPDLDLMWVAINHANKGE